MSFDSTVKSVAHELNPLDFVSGLYDSAVRQPVDAIRQLAGAKVENSTGGNDTLAGKAGGLAGYIMDFMLVSKASGAAMDGMFDKAALATPAGSAAKMFVAGGIYGGILTPSSENKSLLEGRAENALVSGATFAVMGGAGKALEGTKFLGGNALLAKVAGNAIAGGAGGVVNSFGSIYFNDGRIARPGEVLTGAAQYAAFGAGFGALDYGLGKGAQKLLDIPQVSEKYYGTKWALESAKKDATRSTYELLNKYNLRHPLQRLGNLVHGFDTSSDTPPAVLTADNNPVVKLHDESSQFFGRIDETEARLAQLKEQDLPRRDYYSQMRDIHDEQQGIRTDFAVKLLNLWHGNSEQPGIAQYSDAELATDNLPAQRIGEIRQSLSTANKRSGGDTSNLITTLAQMSGHDLPAERFDNSYDPIGEMEEAKARFYNIDTNQLMKRMGMPSLFHAMDAHFATPKEWMPYEPTDLLPNYFHGSISHSLPSLFQERAMLPSAEMRLRAIPQITGESADQEFPNRSISLTRDFNEAYAYHRHSPMYLDSYPVVFGVSADTTAKVRSAGAAEPGEWLVNKLGVGSSLLTRLGLRKPELTHIYVPDSEVGKVNKQLSAYRIKGVRVVGFNNMPAPTWKPEPTQEQLKEMYPYG